MPIDERISTPVHAADPPIDDGILTLANDDGILTPAHAADPAIDDSGAPDPTGLASPSSGPTSGSPSLQSAPEDPAMHAPVHAEPASPSEAGAQYSKAKNSYRWHGNIFCCPDF